VVITETVRLVNSISHSSPEDGSLCPWATRYLGDDTFDCYRRSPTLKKVPLAVKVQLMMLILSRFSEKR
jgi:hypothetical protein